MNDHLDSTCNISNNATNEPAISDNNPSTKESMKRRLSDLEAHTSDNKRPHMIHESNIPKSSPSPQVSDAISTANKDFKQSSDILKADDDKNVITEFPSENLFPTSGRPLDILKPSDAASIDLPRTSQSESEVIPSTSSNLGTQAGGNCSIIHAGITEEEINEIINGLGDDIDTMLDERAERNQLTAKNVKSILRHVISNKYVLAMVRNTMRGEGDEECDLEEAVFEPKLTRSKAKELREKQAVLPWPMSTPVKQKEPISNKLLLEEFSDNEGSSDEEYKPNDEELHSAEEDNGTVNKECDKKVDSDTCSDFPCFVIDEPEVPLSSESEKDLADRIALRTRSKLPLTDTPLEKIEASFVAPDITVDMYDTVIDDEEWQKFLFDFINPLDDKSVSEQVDDDADDPEYNVMEDEHADEPEDEEHENEEPDDEDLKNDVADDVVTREEMSDLMSEILQCAGQELGEIEEEEQEQNNGNITNCLEQASLIAEILPCGNYCEEANTWFTPYERLQLEQQMRMHVQLLSQTFLLSFGIKKFSDITDSSVAFLEELKMFADRLTPYGAMSSFCSCNLQDALDIMYKFRVQPNFADDVLHTSLGTAKKGISPCVKEMIAHSKVFIYPDLLPLVPYQACISKRASKSFFTRAEDNLIVMGLEQFSDTGKPIHFISSLLLTCKTEQQIKYRIKNVRATHAPEDNPIKRYYKYKEIPQISRYVRPFNPTCIVPPCDMPIDILPPWMAAFSKPTLHTLAPQPCIPVPIKNILKVTGAVAKPLEYKLPEKRKYPPILPRGYVSPLKKISPILRKYHRRVVTMPTLCVAAPVKQATVIKKQCPRPLKPKEKSTEETEVLPCKPMEVQSKGKPLAIVTPMMMQPTSSPESPVHNILKDMPIKNTTPEIVTLPFDQNTERKDSVTLKELDTIQVKCINEKETVVEVDGVEVVDNPEADAVDDEQDLAALMAASSTICRKSSVVKKKNKQQRDLESSLALLSPLLMESDPKKEERDKLFAHMYLLRVLEALRNHPDQCEKFLRLLCTFESSSKSTLQLFSEVSELLKEHPALADDFAGFLLPEQARDCGKYIQHRTLCKIREFLRKIEVHFSNQPHHIQRILRAFSQLRQQNKLTASSVMATLQPLLKNQSHLIEELMQLLPDGPPPECLMTESDFEDIRIPNSDGENSADSFEEIIIPETKDPYGGKDCPCTCHTSVTDVRMSNRNRHCSKCGTKFIDGRIYIQTGKVLKPAHVTYHELETTSANPLRETKSDGAHGSISFSASDASKSKTAQNLLENFDAPKQACDNRASKKSSCSSTQCSQQLSKPHKSLMKVASENVAPESCISSVPCYMEDAALLPDSCSNITDVPSDFSCLSKVISSKGLKSCGSTSVAQSTKPIPNTKKATPDTSGGGQPKSSGNKVTSKSLFQQDLSHSSTSLPTSIQSWTREEDKLILETCEKYGVNVEAFATAATTISTRTVQQVQNRFFELMEFVKQQLKTAAR